MKENFTLQEFHCADYSFQPIHISFSKEHDYPLALSSKGTVSGISKSKYHHKSIGGWCSANSFCNDSSIFTRGPTFHRVSSNCLFKPEQDKFSRKCSFAKDSSSSAECISASVSTKETELFRVSSIQDFEVSDNEEQLKKRLADSLSPSPFRDEDPSRREAKLDRLVAVNSCSAQSLKFYEKEMMGEGGHRAWKIALKDHIVHTFESICLIKNSTPVPMHIIEKKLLPSNTWLHSTSPYHTVDKKLIAFDLDETLVHCVTDNIEKADKVVTIKLNTEEEIKAGVNIRPKAVECLKELGKFFELVVFTASEENYANKVIDLLDPENVIFRKRLFRNSCIRTDNNLFIKDLRILNRDLKSVIIVDNSIFSFASQLDNGVPIIPFYDDKEDRILTKIKDYLLSLKDLDDFRIINKKTFSLTELYQLDILSFLKYYYEDSSANFESSTEGTSDSTQAREGESIGMGRRAQKDVESHLGKLRDSFRCLARQKSKNCDGVSGVTLNERIIGGL
eukprot:TRINITY_DN5661_c0_g1_i14.p1 TRINITY_DN5661_c0_g1~~TRINITY_DN5661_c0_g1_i14.p1  ORF type:complete len:507 (+),score=123.59 TRINITY_DN5661_c0_g1_i14:267-1787(+)